ncbi:hypothetical protein [Sinomonas gamaensis]|uniref:hypothetical protein n=1 Tax=Sinomonas gamaensis TaxID=2565624 RepID=UPI001109EEF8|nr:hypothetical protein [Sinomonas gamaensis]
MAKNPSGHRTHESDRPEDPAKQAKQHHGIHLGEWLKREDEGIERGYSSIFLSSHDRPRPPERTCIQGHEIPPGQDHCLHGHPVG